MTPRLRLPLLLLVAAAATETPCSSAAPVATEAEVKAAFIFHFTQFVSWPGRSFRGSDEPFCIGVVGNDEVVRALTDMARGESFGRHPLEVVPITEARKAEGCQILYVSREGEGFFRQLRLESKPVLTVGETDTFIRTGGMIRFFLEQNHVRLRINLSAARAASLDISAKLLRVAQIYPEP